MRIPVDAERGQIDGIVAARRRGSRYPAALSRVRIVIRDLEMKPTAADKADRFAEGGRDGGQKVFIVVKRHRHTPSP